MEYYCISDIGLVRSKNQDSYMVSFNKYDDCLALVADGIGGGKAGEVASGEAISYFKNIFEESGPFSTIDDIKAFLKLHIDKCNKEIFNIYKNIHKFII